MANQFDSLIRAVQGNFDHLIGTLRNLGAAHNAMVDDIEGVQLQVTTTDAVVSTHEHDGTDGTVVLDHGDLTGRQDNDNPDFTTEVHGASYIGFPEDWYRNPAGGYLATGVNDVQTAIDQLDTGVWISASKAFAFFC